MKYKPQVVTFPAPIPTKVEEPKTIVLECLYGPHKAELLHKGTAYCRACYDKRNPTGELVN